MINCWSCCFKRETKPAVVARWSQGFQTTRSGAKVSTCGSDFFIGLNIDRYITHN